MILKPRTRLGRLILVLLVICAIVYVVRHNKPLKNRLVQEQATVTRIIYKETAALVRFTNKKDTVSKTVMVAKRLRNEINGVLSDIKIKDIFKTIKR